MMTVKAILGEKGSVIFTAPPDATLEEVSRQLTHKRIGSVLVMDGERIAGILSERDIVRAIAAEGAAALPRPVSSQMTRKVETCGLDDLVDEVMAKMTNSRIRHLPVLHEGKIVGVVSIGDVVKARIEEAVRETDDMRAYIHQTG